jgi:sec-independent protein translocase protein TatA
MPRREGNAMPLGWQELTIILVIVIIIFGAGKLPEIGGALGKGIKEFKSEAADLEKIDSGKATLVRGRDEPIVVEKREIRADEI